MAEVIQVEMDKILQHTERFMLACLESKLNPAVGCRETSGRMHVNF